MKFIISTAFLFMFSAAMADVPPIAKLQISSKTLGGSVLMIQMRYAMVVNADVQIEITKELGAERRKNLFKDMTMAKGLSYLKLTYSSETTKATNELLKRYESLHLPERKMSLN